MASASTAATRRVFSCSKTDLSSREHALSCSSKAASPRALAKASAAIWTTETGVGSAASVSAAAVGGVADPSARAGGAVGASEAAGVFLPRVRQNRYPLYLFARMSRRSLSPKIAAPARGHLMMPVLSRFVLCLLFVALPAIAQSAASLRGGLGGASFDTITETRPACCMAGWPDLRCPACVCPRTGVGALCLPIA